MAVHLLDITLYPTKLPDCSNQQSTSFQLPARPIVEGLIGECDGKWLMELPTGPRVATSSIILGFLSFRQVVPHSVKEGTVIVKRRSFLKASLYHNPLRSELSGERFRKRLGGSYVTMHTTRS